MDTRGDRPKTTPRAPVYQKYWLGGHPLTRYMFLGFESCWIEFVVTDVFNAVKVQDYVNG